MKLRSFYRNLHPRYQHLSLNGCDVTYWKGEQRRLSKWYILHRVHSLCTFTWPRFALLSLCSSLAYVVFTAVVDRDRNFVPAGMTFIPAGTGTGTGIEMNSRPGPGLASSRPGPGFFRYFSISFKMNQCYMFNKMLQNKLRYVKLKLTVSSSNYSISISLYLSLFTSLSLSLSLR